MRASYAEGGGKGGEEEVSSGRKDGRDKKEDGRLTLRNDSIREPPLVGEIQLGRHSSRHESRSLGVHLHIDGFGTGRREGEERERKVSDRCFETREEKRVRTAGFG